MQFDLYLYALILRRILPPASLAEAAHAEVCESCDACRLAWSVFGELRTEAPRFAPSSASVVPAWPSPLPADLRQMSDGDIEARTTLKSRIRLARRHGMEDLRRLLSLPAEGRAACIRRSVLRYRSRAVAELLLEAARDRFRSHPREAENLASLVPLVLGRIPGGEDQRWRTALALRAAAYEANAVRIAGDLAAAHERFSTLRRQAPPVLDPATAAELDSLEASLRIGQRRVEEGARLLERAIRQYRRCRNEPGEARALVQQANLLRSSGHPDAVPGLLEAAADRLGEKGDPYLFLCTVTGRVNALCDLDRADEAAALLDAHGELYAASDDPYTVVMLRALAGRVALGQGRHDEAAGELSAACDTFLELGRGYDAALAALYLAEVYLEAGRVRELEEVAGDLVAAFQARGVERETLAALRLLATAARAREVTAALLRELRGRVQGVGELV